MTEQIVLAIILYCAVHYLLFKAGEKAQAFRASKKKDAGCTSCGCGDKTRNQQYKLGPNGRNSGNPL